MLAEYNDDTIKYSEKINEKWQLLRGIPWNERKAPGETRSMNLIINTCSTNDRVFIKYILITHNIQSLIKGMNTMIFRIISKGFFQEENARV